MKLPVNEEDNHSNVMGVVELLESSIRPSPPLLDGEPNHNAQRDGHHPTSGTWSSCEIGQEELNDDATSVALRRLEDGELGEVHHVSKDVHKSEEYDRPCHRFVESDVLVEGNYVVEGGAAKERDKVATNGEENEYHVDMENKSC